MTTDYHAQVTRYRTVSDRLCGAIAAQSSARAAYDAARDALDDHRDTLILDGVPGVPGLPERCSAEVRNAALARSLAPLTGTMREARNVLRAGDAELETAQVLERAEREALRSLQLAHAL